MKYIMLEVVPYEGAPLEQHVPIIFPDQLTHSCMFEAVMRSKDFRRNHVSVVSAGFINLDDCTVYGRSETLGVASREQDTETIRNYEYYHGIQTG